MYRRLWIGLTIAATMCASAATAQVEADAMARGRQPRQVHARVDGKVEYSTNVARASDAIAARQGIVPEDTTYAPTARVNIVQPIGQQAVFLDALTSYQFYDKNTQLDYARVQASGGVGNSIGPCGSVVGGGYFRRRNSVEDAQLVVFVDNIQTTRSVNASIACVRAPSLTVLARAERQWSSNSRELSSNGDSESDLGTVGISYAQGGVGTVGLVGNYNHTRYPDRPVNVGGPKGYEAISGGVRVERRLGGRIQTSGMVSYTSTKIESAPVSVTPGAPVVMPPGDFQGLTYEAEVSYRVSSRLQGRARFAREVAPSLIPGAAFEVRTTASAHVDYHIGTRFTFGVGAEQRDNNIKGAIVTTTQLTDASTRVFDASLRYRQSKRVSLVLQAAREERDASQAQFDYVSKRIGLALELSY